MKVFAHAKSVSILMLTAFTATAAYSAEPQEEFAWHQANTVIFGTGTLAAGSTSLMRFLDSGEFTRAQRQMMLSAQEFSKKAWVKFNLVEASDYIEPLVKDLGRPNSLLKDAPLGAIRVTVDGMSETAAERAVYDRYFTVWQAATDRIARQTYAKYRDSNTAIEIDQAIADSDFPLAPGRRQMLMQKLSDEVSARGSAFSATELAVIGEYIDNHHAVATMNRSRIAGRPLPEPVAMQIELLKQPTSLILSAEQRELPAIFSENPSGRKFSTVEVMSVADYQKILADSVKIDGLQSTAGMTRFRRKAVGGIAGIAAIVLGGVTVDQYTKFVKAEARKGWAPQQVQVK